MVTSVYLLFLSFDEEDSLLELLLVERVVEEDLLFVDELEEEDVPREERYPGLLTEEEEEDFLLRLFVTDDLLSVSRPEGL